MKQLWGIKPLRYAIITGWILLAVTFWGFVLSPLWRHTPEVKPAAAVEIVCLPDTNQLLTKINDERTSLGVPTLTVDPVLNDTAQKKLDDMVAGHYYGHDLLNGDKPDSIFREAGVKAAFAEDLDFNGGIPAQDWQNFKNSPAHYESLVNSRYTRIGLASKCTDFKVEKVTGPADNSKFLGVQANSLTVVHLAAPEVAEVAVPEECRITTCADGSCSQSTGQGTCSYHGGIAY